MGSASIKPLPRDHPVADLVTLNKAGRVDEKRLVSDASIDLCMKTVVNSPNHYLIVYTASQHIADLIHFEIYEVPKITQLNLDKAEPRREEALSYEYITSRDGKETRVPLSSLLGLLGNVHLVDRNNCCIKIA